MLTNYENKQMLMREHRMEAAKKVFQRNANSPCGLGNEHLAEIILNIGFAIVGERCRECECNVEHECKFDAINPKAGKP